MTRFFATRIGAAVVCVLLLLLCCPLASAAVELNLLSKAFLSSLKVTFPELATRWPSSSTYCEWSGVNCKNSTYVTLDLVNVAAADGASLPEVLTTGIMFTYIGLDISTAGATLTLPSSWSKLDKLTSIYLAGNIVGTLPETWGTALTSLTVVMLKDTSISGTIPASWSSMTALSTLYFTNNVNLAGTLPWDWNSMNTATYLWMSNNSFTGALPDSLFTSSTVQQVTFAYNNFSGSLPSYANMSNLAYLDLSYNSLTGSLPANWTLPSLAVLNLAGNNFCGCKPASWNSNLFLSVGVRKLPVSWANCSTANSCDGSSTSGGSNAVSGPLSSTLAVVAGAIAALVLLSF